MAMVHCMHMPLQVRRHGMMARPFQLVRAEVSLQPPLAAVPPGHTLAALTMTLRMGHACVMQFMGMY